MKINKGILIIRCLTLILLFTVSLGAHSIMADCYYLPPGGPMRFGMHEVSRLEITAEVGESPIWMDDGRIIAGAPESSQGGYRRGAVYVFAPYSSKLTPDLVLLPPIPEIGSVTGNFGAQLATSGPWLAARAELTNSAVVICMFQTNETGFVYRTNLVAATGASGERLGDAVQGFAMHGRWLAAIRYGNSNVRILMFRVNDNGIWEKKQELIHPQYHDSMPNDAKVDIHGDTLVWASSAVGNYNNPGRVDVWKMDNQGVWNYDTRLVPQGFTTGNLGAGLDVSRDRIFLGAPGFERTEIRGGAIFIYKKVNGEWKEESRITAAADFVTPQFIGRYVAYSDLGGEYLAEASNSTIRMFRPDETGSGWKLASSGTPGRSFEDWESPAGNIQDYYYGNRSSTILYLSARAHQVLTGYRFLIALHEHGMHAIQSLHFTGDPECMRRPLFYVPIGAPRDGTDKKLGDMDSDGIPDLAEVYFGTFMDASNQLSAGLQATAGGDQQRIVEWFRYKDPALIVEARPEWSIDLVNWKSEGITVTKVGEDPAGRELMQASLPETTALAYMRLVLTNRTP